MFPERACPAPQVGVVAMHEEPESLYPEAHVEHEAPLYPVAHLEHEEPLYVKQ